MSIAVVAVIQPSKTLLYLSCAMCVGVLGIAIIVGFGMIGDLGHSSQIGIAGSCFLMAFFVLYRAIWRRSVFHVAISGAGQIRVAECKSSTNGRKNSVHQPVIAEAAATLMAGSTIWSSFILLRLRLESGALVTILVLPDSLPAETFRALAVACRWIAAHEHAVKY